MFVCVCVCVSVCMRLSVRMYVRVCVMMMMLMIIDVLRTLLCTNPRHNPLGQYPVRRQSAQDKFPSGHNMKNIQTLRFYFTDLFLIYIYYFFSH